MIRIVIVDDHQMFIDGLKELLSSLNNVNVVGTANNGKELITLVDSITADLFLMDINMPEMDGVEATKELLKIAPASKVLMLTMSDSRDSIQRVLKAGAHGYILKNTGKEELENAMESVMSGNSFFSAEVTKTIMEGLQNKPEQSNNSFQVELTQREIDVLKQIAQELTTKEIAEKLYISPHTVETHRKNLISKLNVRNVVGLVKYAVQNGYVEE